MLCEEVAEALVERGHEISVLTSTYGIDKPESDRYIHRILSLENDLDYYRISKSWFYPMKRIKNLNYFRRLVDEFKPDIIFIWGMWSLTKQLPLEAEKRLGARVVYYLANPWPIEPNTHRAYWDSTARKSWSRLVKSVLRILFKQLLKYEWKKKPLKFLHAPCCSIALRDQLIEAGVALRDPPIIYEGIDLEYYQQYANEREFSDINRRKFKLTYVGILAPHKGVHTTIEAIAALSQDYREKTSLTILGTGHPTYESYLHDLVDQYHLGHIVKFKQPIPRSELPEFLSKYHALLLPSTWEEPLARIMQEAMASGMVLIGTRTGGTKETIVNGQNGMLFDPEDANGLAELIEKLIINPELCRKISENGKKTAIERFDIVRMVDDIEAYLLRVHEISISN